MCGERCEWIHGAAMCVGRCEWIHGAAMCVVRCKWILRRVLLVCGVRELGGRGIGYVRVVLNSTRGTCVCGVELPAPGLLNVSASIVCSEAVRKHTVFDALPSSPFSILLY